MHTCRRKPFGSPLSRLILEKAHLKESLDREGMAAGRTWDNMEFSVFYNKEIIGLMGEMGKAAEVECSDPTWHAGEVII